MRLHGFVVLPETLELVATPLNLSVSALVSAVESETTPPLRKLVSNGGLIWSRYFMRTPLDTQRAFNVRLSLLLLSPIARGLSLSPEAYPHSSANPRYSGVTSTYTGFHTTSPLAETAPLGGQDELQETTPINPSPNGGDAAKSES